MEVDQSGEEQVVDMDQDDFEFWLELDRSSGQTLGIEVTYLDGETLFIDQIHDDGLFKKWNDAAPVNRRIHNGDHIIEVNGKRGKASDLLEECGKSQQLKVKVWSRNQASAVQAAAQAA